MPFPKPKKANKFSKRILSLGRRAARPEKQSKILKFANYFKGGSEPPPASVDYYTPAAKALASMLGNDALSDCTIAAALHQLGVDSAEQPGGASLIASTTEADTQYATICGPGDNGCVVTDVLDYWQSKGLTAAGTTVTAAGYVSIDTTNQTLLQTAIYLFGALHFGIQLPEDWYENAAPGAIWDVSTAPIVGGHSIAIVGYDGQYLYVSTWGMVLKMTYAAAATLSIVQEAYAVLATDWTDADGLDVHGVDVDTLTADLAIVKAGGTPPIPGSSPPPSPPSPGPAPTGTLVGSINPLTWAVALAPATSGTSGSIRADLEKRGISGDLLTALTQLVTDLAAQAPWSTIAADVGAVLAAL